MRIYKTEQGFAVESNGRRVIEHSPVAPFVCAVVARYDYKTSHGNFKVKEKIEKRVPLSESEIVENGEKKAVVCLKNGKYGMKIAIAEEESNLRFEFEPLDVGVGYQFEFCAEKGEGIFGGGEQYRQLNLKGEKVQNCVSEHIVVPPIVQKVLLKHLPYKAKPHSYIDTYSPMSTFVSSEKYAIRFFAESYGVEDFLDDDKHVFRYQKCPKGALYVSGDTFADVNKALNNDIACNEYLPDWAYEGMILGVQGGIDRAEELAHKMKNAGAKVCGVWCQDWSGKKVTAAGKQVYWNWEVDETLYPSLKNRIEKLKSEGVHFLAYINPYLVKDGKLYNYCKNLGYLIKRENGEIYHVKSTTFDAGMLDLTNPDAVSYIKNTLITKNMLDLGVDGYMADFGEYLPLDCVLKNGDAKLLHNEWPTLWAKINREAVDAHERAKDIFFFTRSGYNACQQYTTMMWNGDQHTDFSKDYGMPCVMPATFNLGFSGLSVTHSDIGGFISFLSLARDKELFVRWMEMNAFSPLMRSHETIRPEVNVQPYGDEILPYTAKLSSLHLALAPYLKECFEQAKTGVPFMRPDFYDANDYAEHKDLYSYLLGSEIYVCPIVERGAKERRVELPAGKWVKFFSGEKTDGKMGYTFAAELGVPIAFYKADGKYASEFAKIKL